MQKDYETTKLKNRIGTLYNRYIKIGVPLSEPLEHYTEKKSLHELTQIETELERFR